MGGARFRATFHHADTVLIDWLLSTKEAILRRNDRLMENEIKLKQIEIKQ